MKLVKRIGVVVILLVIGLSVGYVLGDSNSKTDKTDKKSEIEVSGMDTKTIERTHSLSEYLSNKMVGDEFLATKLDSNFWKLDIGYDIPEGYEVFSINDHSFHSGEAAVDEQMIICTSGNVIPEGMDKENEAYYDYTKIAPIYIFTTVQELMKYENKGVKDADLQANDRNIETYAFDKYGRTKQGYSYAFGEAEVYTYFNGTEGESETTESYVAVIGVEDGQRGLGILLRKDSFTRDEALKYVEDIVIGDTTFMH